MTIPVTWENAPSEATPLDAATLNAMQAYFQTQADAALSAKVDAEAAAAAATAPTDTMVANLANDDTTPSVTRVALDALYRTGLPADSMGVVADGTTDDTVALQAAWDAAAVYGIPLRLPAASTVLVDAITIPAGGRLDLNGSTLKRATTTGTAMLTGTGISGVEIWGGTIDGDKASYATSTEWRHGVNLLGCSRVSLHDLTLTAHKGDGVYVGINGSTECSDVVLDRVICDASHRNGMSVIAVDGLVATACRFISTSGTAPQAGCDIEPNSATEKCTRIRFVGCTFSGNTGNGFLVALNTSRTAEQGKVTLTACAFDANTLAGIRLTESEDVQILGGSASSNATYGIHHDTNTATNTKIVGLTVKANGGHGIFYSGVFAGGLAITACTVDSNGASTTGDGVYIAPSSTSTGFRFIGNSSGGASQRYGLTLGANAQSVMCIGNVYPNNGTAARSGTSVITMDMDYAGAAAAIASPTSDTVGTKVAIDAIRVALIKHGITL